MFNWFSQSKFNGPMFKPPMKIGWIDSDSICPVFKNHCLAFKCYLSILLSITTLVFHRGPLAIIWFIISIISNSINRIFSRRRITHISEEIFKFMPLLTDFNSTATILREFLIFRIITSAQHCRPSFIDKCLAHSMSSASFAYILFSIAAARNHCSTRKMASRNYFLSAAITMTEKLGSAKRIIFSTFNNKQSIKPMVDKINIFTHI